MYTIKLYTAVYAAYSLLHVQHTPYRNNLIHPRIHPVDWFPSARDSNHFRSDPERCSDCVQLQGF